jgi:hypothetical protein
MLDPRERKKGGVGAFAERERQRSLRDGADHAPASADVSTDAIAMDRDGPAAAAPRRRRFFGFLLP